MPPNQVNPDLPTLDHRPLPGSERAGAPDAHVIAPVGPDDPVSATLVLRRDPAAPNGIGGDPGDLATVVGTMQGLGLSVDSSDLPSRRVRISGSARRMEHAFGTNLDRVESTAPDGTRTEHRHRTGSLSVPAVLDGIVIGVLGLDDRPQTRAYIRLAAPGVPGPAGVGAGAVGAVGAVAAPTSYTPVEVGALYQFPAGADGSGTTIAIVELGGGFAQSDLDAYFTSLGISGPSVTAVGVDGAANQPGQDPNGADGEVLLDIEVAGALAPGAHQTVYFAPNTDAGFLDAVSTAVHTSPAPVALSISWGQSEDAWTDQARRAMDDAFADAATLGVTVTVAAGDNGSSDAAGAGQHADFPASSPHVLACGGTTLTGDPGTGTIASETVWNDGTSGGATGGGVSDVFAQPSWQAQSGVPARSGGGRGVPDVAGNADPQTGYRVRVDGAEVVVGGTSAVAPLWAALVARLAQAVGHPFGLLNATLYAGVAQGQPAPGCNDITSGDNGAFAAGPGWDACTGLGTPNGGMLLERLRAGAAGS